MTERTEYQSGHGLQKSKDLSLQGSRPPAEIPGYEIQGFLGAGAYGEVWVALDRNTQRRVAVKFYTHRTGVDWTLLSREVEKLAFLSADRYVVQLLDVGWDAKPPFFVMEYIEQGSLDQRLADEGPLPVGEAVEMFQEVATGLMHAHAKGVLHCDLKPANVLLDQDAKPRLADFGQSRLSHEQTPALGTLFYMAPEQADTSAVPDARWDVYALGALLYCMLTGQAPYRDKEVLEQLDEANNLEQRLACYRHAIRRAPMPTGHREVPGVDKALAEIIEGCLQADPAQRFPNVQTVLDALAIRDARRARRPLVVLGALGPMLLLLVVSIFVWRGFVTVVRQTDESLTKRVLDSNEYAARYVARAAGDELSRRYRAVEEVARDGEFLRLMQAVLNDDALSQIREKLNRPDMAKPENEAVAEQLRTQLREHPLQQQLSEYIVNIRHDVGRPETASWFANDPTGLQLARDPASHTVGKNYGWRTYFTGQSADQPNNWRPGPSNHLTETHLSAVFLSQASNNWIVTISTPIFDNTEAGKFLGIVALTVEVGGFVELRSGSQRFGVLVDLREGENQGLVLQHPIFDKLRGEKRLSKRVSNTRLHPDDLPKQDTQRKNYQDPFAAEAEEYNQHWLAEIAPVKVLNRATGDEQETGLHVIVQQSRGSAIGDTISELKQSLLTNGMFGLLLVAVVNTLLWGFVLRQFNNKSAANRLRGNGTIYTTTETMATLPDVEQMRKDKSSS